MNSAPRFSPRVQEHIAEAYDNRQRYLRMLEIPEDAKWGAVFLFYSALHLVQAYARHYTPNDVPSDHSDRGDYVAYYFPEHIAAYYNQLLHISNQVRYHLVTFSEANIRSLHDNTFAQLRKYLRDSYAIVWQEPVTQKSQDINASTSEDSSPSS